MRGTGAMLLVSAVVHLVVVVALAWLAPSSRVPLGVSRPMEIEFTTQSDTGPESNLVASSMAAEDSTTTRSPPRPARTTTQTIATSTSVRDHRADDARDTRAGCAPPEAGPVTWAAIDPHAAAASLLDEFGSPDAVSRPRAEGRQRPALANAISDDLRRAAMTKNHVSRRSPPRLHPHRDGTYRYESPQFDAVIARNGTVTFSDRHVSMAAIDTVVFDVYDEMLRARGEDPYGHERQWFMESTEALRGRLADAADDHDVDWALRRLPVRLARIWSADAVPAARRRARIFAVWDDCADDALGHRARAIVEAFVLRELPHGSPNAYTDRELALLNADRVSPVPFAPYG